RTNGGRDDDLFSFEILNVYLKGNIKAKLKNLPLNDVLVRMTINGIEVSSSKTDEQGNFFFTLEPSEEYTLTAYKENFKVLYNSFSTKHRGASDTIQQELVLEKEVKTVVKGIVNQNSSAVPLLKIIALETKTLHLDTLLSDDRGEFFFEADPGLEYLFYVDTRYAFGEVLLEPSKKTKGTFLLYTKIELHNYDTTFVNVQIKDGSLPAVNALVVLENSITRKMDSLYTNKKGMIRFVAKSYTNYNISSRYKKKAASLYGFNLLTNRMRTLVLHLEEEEGAREEGLK
ncbi:MAG: hypothetical protein JWO58_717, partial [Chitinophagaceae bacterium]|nr:hypothetical protein [Chitinophagaceae bacterium]